MKDESLKGKVKNFARTGEGRAFILYTLFALISTFPIVMQMNEKVLGHPGNCDTWDHVWHLWILKYLLVEKFSLPFFTDMVAYPRGVNIYISDPISTLIFMPFLFILPLAVDYNLMILCNLIFSGIGMFIFVKYLTGSNPAALFAGSACAFSPFILSQVSNGISEGVAVGWLPLFFLFLFRIVREGGWKNVLYSGFFLFVASYANWYSGFFIFLAFPPVLLYLILFESSGIKRRLRHLAMIGIACTAGLVLTFPFLVAFLSSLQDPVFHYKTEENLSLRKYSPYSYASLNDFFRMGKRYRPNQVSPEGYFEIYAPISSEKGWIFPFLDTTGDGVDHDDYYIEHPFNPLNLRGHRDDTLYLKIDGNDLVPALSVFRHVKLKGEIHIDSFPRGFALIVFAMRDKEKLPGSDTILDMKVIESPPFNFEFLIPAKTGRVWIQAICGKRVEMEDSIQPEPFYGLRSVEVGEVDVDGIELSLKPLYTMSREYFRQFKGREEVSIEGEIEIPGLQEGIIRIDLYERYLPFPIVSKYFFKPGNFNIKVPENIGALWLYGTYFKKEQTFGEEKSFYFPYIKNPIIVRNKDIENTTFEMKRVPKMDFSRPERLLKIRGKIDLPPNKKGQIHLAMSENHYLDEPSLIYPLLVYEGKQHAISYIGYLLILPALLSLFFWKREKGLWLFIALFFLLLAMGPYFQVDDRFYYRDGFFENHIFTTLDRSLPVFKNVEFVYRFVMMVTFSLSILAAFLIKEIERRLGESKGMAISLSLTSLLLFEYLFLSPLPYPLPESNAIVPPFYREMGKDDTDYAVFDLPSNFRGDANIIYLYYQAFHRKKIPYEVNQLYTFVSANTNFLNLPYNTWWTPYSVIYGKYKGREELLERERIMEDIDFLRSLNFRYIVLHGDTMNHILFKKGRYLLTKVLGEPEVYPGKKLLYKIR